MEINERFKKVRDLLNFNQSKFAEALGSNQPKIADIEKGKQRLAPELAKKIEELFNINLRWLLFEEGEIFLPKTSTVISEEDIQLVFFDPRVINIEGYLSENKELKDYLIFKKRYIKHVLNVDTDKVSLIVAMDIRLDDHEKYINRGDLVMYDKSQTEPKSEGIYVIRHTSNFYIANIKQIDKSKIKVIHKEYPDHPSCIHSLDDPLEFMVIGKVVWVGKKFPPNIF